jgi:hypothetical protein
VVVGERAVREALGIAPEVARPPHPGDDRIDSDPRTGRMAVGSTFFSGAAARG